MLGKVEGDFLIYFNFTLLSFTQVLAATDTNAWEYTVAVCSFFVSSQGMVNALVYSNFEAVTSVSNMWSAMRSSFRNSRLSFSSIDSVRRRFSFEMKHYDPEADVITPSNIADVDQNETHSVANEIEMSVPDENESVVKTDTSDQDSKIDLKNIFDSDFDDQGCRKVCKFGLVGT